MRTDEGRAKEELGTGLLRVLRGCCRCSRCTLLDMFEKKGWTGCTIELDRRDRRDRPESMDGHLLCVQLILEVEEGKIK